MRYMGIDYGRRRIGLSISDPLGSLASPAGTLPAKGVARVDAQNVAVYAERQGIEAFIVGLPLNMDGSEGPQAKLTRDFADQLAAVVGPRPVAMWDERLSSFAADQLLEQTHLSTTKRAGHRDQIAAMVILQSYLDAQAHRPSEECSDSD